MTCIFLARCSSKATSIVKDPTHPSHSLFQLLPSGRLYRSIRACSARLLNSFFPRLWEPSIPITSPHSETSSTTLAPETQDPPPSYHTTLHAPHENCWKPQEHCAILSVLHTGEWAGQTTCRNTKLKIFCLISAQERLCVVSKQKEIYRHRYRPNWVEKYRHIGYRQKSNIVHP